MKYLKSFLLNFYLIYSKDGILFNMLESGAPWQYSYSFLYFSLTYLS